MHLYSLGLILAPPVPIKTLLKAFSCEHKVKHKPLIAVEWLISWLGKAAALCPVAVTVVLVAVMSALRKSDLMGSHLDVCADRVEVCIRQGKNRPNGRIVGVSRYIIDYYRCVAGKYNTGGVYSVHSGRTTWASVAHVYGLPEEDIMDRLGHMARSTLSSYILPFEVHEVERLRHPVTVMFLVPKLFSPREIGLLKLGSMQVSAV